MSFKKAIKAYRKRSSSNVRKVNMSRHDMSPHTPRHAAFDSMRSISHVLSPGQTHGHHTLTGNSSIHISNLPEIKSEHVPTGSDGSGDTDGHGVLRVHTTIWRAKALLEQLNFFTDGGRVHRSAQVPAGVKGLLEGLVAEEKLDMRLKKEILTDGDARRDLYFVNLQSKFPTDSTLKMTLISSHR